MLMENVVIVCGLMGTGKTTFARQLGKAAGLDMIRSDVVRKQLAQIDVSTHEYENFGAGIYSPQFTERTYQALCDQAAEYLKKGRSVIVDAVFGKQRQRHIMLDTVRRMGAGLIVVECVCPDDIVRGRLVARESEGADASDGRWALFPQQKKSYEPLNVSEGLHHLTVQTHQADSMSGAIEKVCGLLSTSP